MFGFDRRAASAIAIGVLQFLYLYVSIDNGIEGKQVIGLVPADHADAVTIVPVQG